MEWVYNVLLPLASSKTLGMSLTLCPISLSVTGDINCTCPQDCYGDSMKQHVQTDMYQALNKHGKGLVIRSSGKRQKTPTHRKR